MFSNTDNTFVLALNCGSSSLKFNLFALSEGKLDPAIQGIIEEIGNHAKSRLKYSICNNNRCMEQDNTGISGGSCKESEKAKGERNEANSDNRIITHAIASHKDALSMIFSEFASCGIDVSQIKAVGHRVVHGGVKYKNSVKIDDEVINEIRRLFPIAPLHNPPNLTGIEEAIKLLPGVPQVAVFDTAFHASIPEYAYRYAVPDEWYSQHGVRRYGFHGTSHLYVSRRAARILGVPHDTFNCISVHLGNGCSITKVRNGKSVDTSMGFTPLEGLVMGTRSGDIDPAIISYVANRLVQEKGLEEAEAFRKVMAALNRESGLHAIGGTNMMQEIRKRAEEGDEASDIVVSIFAYRVAKYIGAYWTTLPYVNAVIFTAGLGENEGYVRYRIMSMLENLRININEEENKKRKHEVIIGKSAILNCCNDSVQDCSTDSCKWTSFLVIPTDEEIVLGYDALYIGYYGEQSPDIYPFES